MSVVAVFYGLGVVALFASSRVVLAEAGLLLGVPVLLAFAVLRPEWTILAVVAIPPPMAAALSPRWLVPILLAALFGCLLEGGLHLGPKTGIYPLLAIIALTVVAQASTTGAAAAAADGGRTLFVYYTLLMLVGFHSTASGRLRMETFIDALLLGFVGAVVLQPFLGSISSWESINYHPFRGQIAYLAVMGFGVAYVRLSLGRSTGGARFALDAFLMLAFLFLTAIGFARTAWMAGLAIFALVSRWAGRKAFWLVSAVLIVLALSIPVVGERVVPGGVQGIAAPERLAQVTTGRSVLWRELWERAVDAPFSGQGWGYVWSLSSEDLFGFEGMFTSGQNPGIFPHNDFLFVFVELGLLGFSLLAAFWLGLLRTFASLSGGPSEYFRYGARVLAPVFVTMFFVQLFGNGFAIRPVSERFFISAGLLFGLRYAVGHAEHLAPIGRRRGGA